MVSFDGIMVDKENSNNKSIRLLLLTLQKEADQNILLYWEFIYS